MSVESSTKWSTAIGTKRIDSLNLVLHEWPSTLLLPTTHHHQPPHFPSFTAKGFRKVMDAKTSMDQLGVTASIVTKSVGKLDNKFADMVTDDNANLSTSSSILNKEGSALSPITPDSKKEGSDLMAAFISLLSIRSDSHMLHNGDNIYMNEDDDCPSTPKAGVFDPFAAGSDDLLMAPVSKKYLEESLTYVARRLNVTSLVTKNIYEKVEAVCESDVEDDMLLEAVYKSLLGAIISKQAEDIISEISASHDALTTPTSAPRLTGIAETCPGAPFKHVKKSRNIDLGLCRRYNLWQVIVD